MMRVIFFLLVLQIVSGITPDDAFKRLMAGNKRYVKDALEHPNRTSERREATTSKQFPYAVIVGCSDSRVPPEIIFDEGVGDLFVVRVAGNVIGDIERESIEYAVQVLGSVFILVMGHENCGAVKAVIEGQSDAMPAIATMIKAAIKEGKSELSASIKDNAVQMKALLLQSPVIQNLVAKKQVGVQAGYYNLQTGIVEAL